MLSYVIFNIRFGFMVDPKNPPIGYSLPWIAFPARPRRLLHRPAHDHALPVGRVRVDPLQGPRQARLQVASRVGCWAHLPRGRRLRLPPCACPHSSCTASSEWKTMTRIPLHRWTRRIHFFEHCLVFKANLWLTGIAFKVIPCILLFVFTFALLYKLDITRRRRRLITSGHSLAARRNDAHSDRTTKLLAVCLAIFLATELPQGILSCLNARFPKLATSIHQFVYLSLGDFLDLLSLVNANTIWILYPLLSSQYRHSLRDYFQCFREKARSRLTSATKLTLHGDTSTLRFLDDRDVLL
ncbi:G-PROTEIN-RECEP-F1-2 domain-containing protein [Aphelenchoides fujianensis]|nr:G-PROTEIN-RECEP-F1-2 domain-containing protein [Aphelenchoides fujianensis]